MKIKQTYFLLDRMESIPLASESNRITDPEASHSKNYQRIVIFSFDSEVMILFL